MSRPLVVGTAGHIDHGKTRLVRLLTGRDLDTLPEERARGITIALGFAPLDLPGGRRAAIVDVPGHERLVRTMIAGATGIDAAILVVSAVDGVMPQTREHLAILELLGVRRGVVALTMADLVDDELLALAEADAADLVDGTFLADAPRIAVSAEDGRGRDALLAALAALDPPERPATGPFRLPIDRAFSRPGFGTVATGTCWSGRLADGEGVRLLPAGTEARVRGVEVHGARSAGAEPGVRVALNLAGVELGAVPRGTWAVRGDVPCPRVLDVQIRLLGEAIPDGAPVRVLLGTSEAIGRLFAAADLEALPSDWQGPAQLRLDQPIPCLPGDRFVLRRTSPVETLGGGEVLDPWSTRMRQRDRLAWGESLRRLAAGDRGVWLERAGEVGLTPEAWSARGGSGGVRLADRVFAPDIAARLERALREGLDAFHAENPLLPGAARRELRRGRLAHLSDRVFDALVEQCPSVEVDGPVVRRAGFTVTLTPAHLALAGRVEATLSAAGLDGMKAADLHAAHPEPETAALLRHLDRRFVQVSGLGWVAAIALDGLVDAVRGWFSTHDTLSPGELKELTGLTRRAAIPLLEWLDARSITAFGAEGRRTAGPALLQSASEDR